MENDQKAYEVSYFKDILKKNDDAMAQFVKVWTNKVNEMERSNVKDDVCGKIRSTQVSLGQVVAALKVS